MSHNHLISLISLGDQDQYLTMSPQLTFFRFNYKPHTNFSNNITQSKGKRICLDFISYNRQITVTECAFCLSDFDCNSKIHITKCNHVYHHQCLYEYIESLSQFNITYNCPLCRSCNEICRE